MERKIDFLGIGAQKAGTSWLYEKLNEHPGVWMPPKKELHYFDRSPAYHSPSHLATDSLLRRLLGKEEYNRKYREMFYRELKNSARDRQWEVSRWYLRYFLGAYGDDWYLSLFEAGAGRMAGEITPAYSILEQGDVQHVRNLLPEVKILLILRNPIDRAWSQLRFRHTRGAFDKIGDIGELKKFLDSPTQGLRGDYVSIINRWGSCFPEDQIFLCYYDDVLKDSRALLSRVFDFLGLDSSVYNWDAGLDEKVNVSIKRDMPKEVSHYLAEKYYLQLKELSGMLGGYTENWLKECEDMMGSPR